MVATGFWKPRRQRAAQIHQPRSRQACVGELIQIDGSDHAWFEDRSEACAEERLRCAPSGTADEDLDLTFTWRVQRKVSISLTLHPTECATSRRWPGLNLKHNLLNETDWRRELIPTHPLSRSMLRAASTHVGTTHMNPNSSPRQLCAAPSFAVALLSAALLAACGGGGADVNAPVAGSTSASKDADFGTIVVDGVNYDAFTDGNGNATVVVGAAALLESAQKPGAIDTKNASVAGTTTVKWTLKSLSVRTNGVPNVFTATPDGAGVSRVTFSKSQAGLLKVGAAIAGIGSGVSMFTLSGPYGTESAFSLRSGATSTGFGQYFNTPQAVAGEQRYAIKGFDSAGRQQVELKLLINLTD